MEQGNIFCLRQLYQDTISNIAANFDLLVQQAYDRQLEMEQLSVGGQNPNFQKQGSHYESKRKTNDI